MNSTKIFIKFLMVFFFMTVIQVQAQRNANPDPNGDPWWTGDALDPLEELTTSSEFIPTSQSLATLLPNFAYNEGLPYFPNIFNQDGGSCVHAAEINYTFTYEINRKRNLTAGDYGETGSKENLYNGIYSYNFYNKGSGENGTPFGSGFNVVKKNGCPSYLTFEDPALHGPNRYKYWMTGYDKYNSGMYNVLLTTHTISFSNTITGQLEWLDKMKHWINDHGNGENTGGLTVIGVFTDNIYGQLSWITNTTIPSNSPYHANEQYVSALGTYGGHALTIVGYNNDVLVQDINGDGLYTNDHDVNGDGIFNIKDYEKGVFKVANSWGSNWGNSGFILMPYKLFYLSNNGFIIKNAYYCDVFSETPQIPTPSLTLKVNIDHNGRDSTSLVVASGENANSQPPTLEGLFKNFGCFNIQGGSYSMRGAYTGPIDIGLNYGYFYQNFGKVFFRVKETDLLNSYSGYINSLSLMDYRWGETFELPYAGILPTPILNNTNTTLSIEYDLLPHHEESIKINTTLATNKVSRFTTNVTENSVLTLNQNVKIDMYSSEIHIDAGSALLMSKGSKITAKRGSCKVIIDGNFSTVGSDMTFAAENDAILDVYFSSIATSNTVTNVNFNNCNVFGNNEALIFNHCVFTNCKEIKSSWGNITFTGSTFLNTGIYLDNSSRNPDYQANVTGCNFTNNLSDMIGINLSRYGCYFISGNTISNYYDGIEINNSGLGKSGNQKIESNIIHSCTGNGIIAYSSIGSIYKNTIYDNYYGVRFMNDCSFALHGDPTATILTQTQEIRDNVNTEVYASEFSFPYYFRYNSIVDADNLGKPSDPLLWFDRPVYANTTKADVAYCHWGTGFNPAQDFMGNNVIFLTYPQWTPGTISPVGPDEDLYTTASTYFADGSYQLAKSQYQLLIDLYSKSQYAEAAIKDLVRLEEYVGKNYAGLKEYFLTNDSIVNDTLLSEIAEISANQCDIRQENYALAIEWYENRIINADNSADSIFAVIDLGYVYLLMEEDGLKSNFIGRFPEYKPLNKIQYNKTKTHLLSLLPGKNIEQSNANIVNASLIQNYPNPSNEATQITYSLNSEASVSIVINDNLGKLVQSYDLGKIAKGTHLYTLKTNNLPSGLYFYSLYVDNKLQQTQKMSVIK